MIELLRHWAWYPLCLIFGHNYVEVDRRPLVDRVRCKDCGRETTGEATLKCH